MGTATGRMIYLIEQLKRIGISERESEVYLALLQLGKASAQTIARRSKIPRATTYSILSQLVEKGLATFFVQDGEHRYGAEHPDQVIRLIELQRNELEARYRVANELLPRLVAFYNAKDSKPKIRYFEGVDGLSKLRGEFVDRRDDILQIVGYDAFMMLQDPASTGKHRDEIRETGTGVRSILITDKDVSIPGQQIICLPPELSPVEGEMTVVGDRVILFSFAAGIIAIEITSKTIADTVRATLELAWRTAQRLTGKE